MCLNISDDFDGLTNSTQTVDEEDDNIDIILRLLILSIPGGVLLLIGLVIWTNLEPFFTTTN